MTTILKSGLPIDVLKKQLENAFEKKNKGINTEKYSGAIKSEIDPIEYQKKIRDEWQ